MFKDGLLNGRRILVTGGRTGLGKRMVEKLLALGAEDLSTRGFDAVANIVMHGTFYVTHAVGKRWIAGDHRGNVVSIVVTWIYNGSPYVVPSSMSKSAIHTMTMSLATEWAGHGIRLNAIAPGVIPTEGASKRLSPDQRPGDRA